jgi:hypothetical protein
MTSLCHTSWGSCLLLSPEEGGQGVPPTSLVLVKYIGACHSTPSAMEYGTGKQFGNPGIT